MRSFRLDGDHLDEVAFVIEVRNKLVIPLTERTAGGDVGPVDDAGQTELVFTLEVALVDGFIGG